ncbi:MAG: hypothetical protein NXI09_15245 [Bacteroidetes bacterium]|nr:hypothetical protein [Bacteroidota bacterium]
MDKRILFIQMLFFLGVNAFGQMDSISIFRIEAKSFLLQAPQNDLEDFIPDSDDIGILVFESDSIGKVFFRAFYLRKAYVPDFEEYLKDKFIFTTDSLGGTSLYYISEKDQGFFIGDGINALRKFRQLLPDEFSLYREHKNSGYYIRPGLNILIFGKYIGDNRIMIFRGLNSPPFILD